MDAVGLYPGGGSDLWAPELPSTQAPHQIILYKIPGFCSGCRTALRPRLRAAGNPRRWCSESCRVRTTRAARPDYVERNRRQAKSRGRARALAAGLSRCRTCAVVVAGQGRRYCDSHRPGPVGSKTATCARCATTFDYAFPSTNPRYCSLACSQAALRAAWHDNNHRRRAAVHGATAERIDPREIFERDGWRCHLCRKPIDRRLLDADFVRSLPEARQPDERPT